jgi:hypothetical protein
MTLGNWSISFGNPWWLILIPVFIPPLVWMSFRSLAGLGGVRRALAIGLRATVITLIIMALADFQSVRRSDRLTTMFLLDSSYSITPDLQNAEREYIAAASRKRRPEDLAGVVVFGREPRVEVPPAPSELNMLGIESLIDHENTDIGAAIKLALTGTRIAATCSSKRWPQRRSEFRWMCCRSNTTTIARCWSRRSRFRRMSRRGRRSILTS